MKKVLVFQHVAWEILGTLNPLLKKEGYRIRYVNFGRTPDEKPLIKGYDGLIVLGGTMNVDQQKQFPHLTIEARAIEAALKEELPVLGICLGAQLLAHVLGARVRPSSRREIGWYDVDLTPDGTRDPVFRGCGKKEKLFQWHTQQFELPSSATSLATSSTHEQQAFRWKNTAYGFQFHLEVDHAMVGRWLEVPQLVQELESDQSLGGLPRVKEDTARHMPRSLELSQTIFGEFLHVLGKPTKKARLSSGHRD